MKGEYAHICTLKTKHCRGICCNLNLDLNLKGLLLKGKEKLNATINVNMKTINLTHHTVVFMCKLEFD